MIRSVWLSRVHIGRYMVGESIGRGAMGEVFRGVDTDLARPVALKRLHVGSDGEAREKLAHEARAAARLQHPNVVAVYEIVEDGDRAVLATEWIDGVTLRAWLDTPRPWRDAVRVVLGAGRGLAAAHAAGIVHRDFKPENVLVDREGRARVADFGLAASASGAGAAVGVSLRGSPMAFMSVTGTLSGTPAYMAPELVDGVRPHAGSDQFAFAVTLFEAVHGRYPFEGKTAEAIWTQMADHRMARGQRRVPGWLDRVLARALSPDPADRYAELATMLDEIERRSRRGLAVPIAITGVVAGAAAVAVSLMVMGGKAPACGDDLVDGVWNAPARAGIAAEFGAIAPGRGAAAAAFTEAALDRWSDAWRLGRRAACAVPAAERSARESCLDRQLGAVQAQLAVWWRADAAVVDRAPSGVASLPPPADCVSATTGAASASLVDATAAVDAMRRAGQFAQARPQATALAQAAETATDPASKARALIAVGGIELEVREYAKAQAHLVVAAQAARQAHDDGLLASALLLHAEVRTAANQPAEALGLCEAVRALGVPDLTTAKIEAVRGEALRALARYDEAIAAYQKSAAIREAAMATDPTQRLEYANSVGALGTTLGSSGRRAEAVTELNKCLALEEPVLGPDHPEVARTLHDIAAQQLVLGELDAATTNYTRARKIFVAALGAQTLEVAAVDASLADIAVTRGDFDHGRALATNARAVYLQNENTRPDLLSSIETSLGNIEQNTDHCAAAIPHYEAALAEAKRAGQLGHELGISYTNLGACLADVSRDAEARNAIEAGIAAWDAAGESGPQRAQAVTILADLEHKAGRRAHAIELDKQVLAAIKGVDGVAPLREYVEGQLGDWQRGK